MRRMIKGFIPLFGLLLFVCISHASAAGISGCPKVAVMDLGVYASNLDLEGAGKTAGEYVAYYLIDDERLTVAERDLMQEKIKAEGLNTEGIIDPEAAQRIAALLGADYLVYGNITDVSVSDTGTTVQGVGGVTIGTTKAHIVLRMMDVATGDIVMAAKGEGKSKTSYVAVSSKRVGIITIGSYTVTYDSVHNAIQKAAADAVNVLAMRLYGTAGNK